MIKNSNNNYKCVILNKLFKTTKAYLIMNSDNDDETNKLLIKLKIIKRVIKMIINNNGCLKLDKRMLELVEKFNCCEDELAETQHAVHENDE